MGSLKFYSKITGPNKPKFRISRLRWDDVTYRILVPLNIEAQFVLTGGKFT